jgi:hypothetical protein
MLRAALVALGVAFAATACTQVTAFEQKAAPEIAQACGAFHQAEANPLVQIALAAGSTAATAASGVPVGAVVSEIRSYGDAFCAAGPPVGDLTTPGQQAAWVMDVAQKMIGAARQ